MKNSIVLSILMYLAMVASPAYASQVYQCTNEDGVATFAFAPCAAAQPAASSEAEGPSVEATMDQISEIDSRIARLNREFRDLRLNHEASLRDEQNVTRQGDLRQDYSKETDMLLDTLSSLRADRERLVSGSVERMAGS